MPSREEIRAARKMIAKAKREIAASKSPVGKPPEPLIAALRLIDDLMLELPGDSSAESSKKRLPN